jgi:hypothetical protein
LDNLIAYIIFLGPGLIIMLINERIGSHTSAKYTNTEKLVMAVLFSVPVLICNLLLHGFLKGTMESANIIALQDEVKTAQGLLVYIMSSLLWSYIVLCVWHDSLKRDYVVRIINIFRNAKGKTDVNEGNIIWEDAFHGREEQAVRVTLKDTKIYGSPINMSESISDERCLLLADCKIVEDIVVKHNVPVDKAYVDTKSGVAVEIFDSSEFKKALELENN